MYQNRQKNLYVGIFIVFSIIVLSVLILKYSNFSGDSTATGEAYYRLAGTPRFQARSLTSGNIEIPKFPRLSGEFESCGEFSGICIGGTECFMNPYDPGWNFDICLRPGSKSRDRFCVFDRECQSGRCGPNTALTPTYRVRTRVCS